MDAMILRNAWWNGELSSKEYGDLSRKGYLEELRLRYMNDELNIDPDDPRTYIGLSPSEVEYITGGLVKIEVLIEDEEEEKTKPYHPSNLPEGEPYSREYDRLPRY